MTHYPSISSKEADKPMDEVFGFLLHCFQLVSHGLQLPPYPVTKAAHAVSQPYLLLLNES